jgi:hypothetical protein
LKIDATNISNLNKKVVLKKSTSNLDNKVQKLEKQIAELIDEKRKHSKN